MADANADSYVIKMFRLDDDSLVSERIVLPSRENDPKLGLRAQDRSPSGPRPAFPDEAIDHLLNYRLELDNLFRDCGDVPDIVVAFWDEIANKIREKGFGVTGDDCSGVWKDLFSSYVAAVKKGDKNWTYFEKLDAVFRISDDFASSIELSSENSQRIAEPESKSPSIDRSKNDCQNLISLGSVEESCRIDVSKRPTWSTEPEIGAGSSAEDPITPKEPVAAKKRSKLLKRKKCCSDISTLESDEDSNFVWDDDSTQCFLDLRRYTARKSLMAKKLLRKYGCANRFVSSKMADLGYAVSNSDCARKWAALGRFEPKTNSNVDFCWSEESTKRLIGIRLPMEEAFATFKKYILLWGHVAAQMARHNWHSTPSQCSVKWMELCESYAECLESMDSGDWSIDWEYFQDMHSGYNQLRRPSPLIEYPKWGPDPLSIAVDSGAKSSTECSVDVARCPNENEASKKELSAPIDLSLPEAGRVVPKRKFLWTEEATRLLIESRCSDRLWGQKKYGTRLAIEMQAHGFRNVTHVECVRKWSQLVKRYKKLLPQKNTDVAIKWEYFKLMDETMERGGSFAQRSEYDEKLENGRKCMEFGRADEEFANNDKKDDGSVENDTNNNYIVNEVEEATGGSVKPNTMDCNNNDNESGVSSLDNDKRVENEISEEDGVNSSNPSTDILKMAISNALDEEDLGSSQSFESVPCDHCEDWDPDRCPCQDSLASIKSRASKLEDKEGNEIDPRHQRVKTRWSKRATNLLIDMRRLHEPYFSKCSNTKIIWAHIADQLRVAGHLFEHVECRRKWFALISIYRNKFEDSTSTGSKIVWPYFDKIETIVRQFHLPRRDFPGETRSKASEVAITIDDVA